VVRINDRGPFVGQRIVDLSYAAAWKLDMLREGTAPVELRVLSPGTVTPLSADAQAPSAPPPAPPVSDSAATTPGTADDTPDPAPLISRSLQAGSFATLANAQSLIDRLAAAGISNTTIRAATIGTQRVYRVRVGPLLNALELDDMVERLRLAGVADARLAHD
jgi:rare lipoprotein A